MNVLKKVKQFSPHQFAIWRILFGLYATYYACAVIPYLFALYSNEGIYKQIPLYFPFPNILYVNNDPEIVLLVGIVSVVASILILIGYKRRIAAFVSWYIHAAFFTVNPLTEDPSYAFVGLLFILLAVIPSREPWSLDRKKTGRDSWYMPFFSYWTALLALGIGYTVSGYDKLLAEGWRIGDAMFYLMNLSVARDNFLVEFVRQLPPEGYAVLTYFSAGVMLFALPALLYEKTRLLIWTLVTGMFVFVTFSLDLTQVSLGMLVFHLFVFDMSWIKPRHSNTGVTIFYDTNCNLCQSYVSFLKAEDFSQVTTYKDIRSIIEGKPVTLICEVDAIRHRYANSVFTHMQYLGGVWRLIGEIGVLVPTIVKDPIYKYISRHRYQWFGTCGCQDK